MKRLIQSCLLALGMAFCAAMTAGAAEWHVSVNGCDRAEGSAAKPWRTIQRAADVAVAGDVVTIHGGLYREWVKPANAGREGVPITYRAAAGESVTVTGANEVRGWTKRPDGLWTAKVRYDTFGGLNPFTDIIFGNWYGDGGRRRFRTRLVQNGKPLELHGDEVFSESNDAAGKYLVNIAGITSAGRTVPGAAAVRRGGLRDGFETKWGRELGWITDGTACEYEGFDFSTPEARRLQFHVSAGEWPARIDVFDARSKRQLGTLQVPKTASWTTYRTMELELPGEAERAKTLRLYTLDKDACLDGAHVFINNVMTQMPSLKKSSIPSRFEDNWVVPAANWQVDDKTGSCTITPPAGEKAPDYKPVTAARLGTSWTIKQPFPSPTVSLPKSK